MSRENKLVPLIFRPPIIALVLLIISVILHFVFPIRKFIVFPYNLTGVLLIILGLQIAMWGKNTFQKEDVELIPGSKSKNVVSSGPFKFSRNPMYLGFVILLFGISVLFGSVSAFLAYSV